MNSQPERTRPAIRDLVVQLTGSDEDGPRLQVAGTLAGLFESHIVGVHLHTLPDILDITDPARSGAIRSLLESSERQADASYRQTEAALQQMAGSHELRRLHGLAKDLGHDLAAIARTADLFIGTRPYGDPEAHHQIEERVLFGSGRGCLFLPPGGRPHMRFETIAVAWSGSRESARALSEAMPFLTRAEAVHLINIAAPEDDADKLLGPVLAHLRRHGVAASPVVRRYTTGTGEQIEDAAHQTGCDLIVMGAYGHARMIEWALGGATRYLLRHSTLPVLMAH